MKKIITLFAIALCLTLLPTNFSTAAAASTVQGKKIIFIPLCTVKNMRKTKGFLKSEAGS